MCVYGKTQAVNGCRETSATIRIDEVNELMTLVVVDDFVQSYDIIVGRALTDSENFTFIKANQQLVFAYGMKLPFVDSDVPYIKEGRSNMKIVRAIEHLPVNSATMVEVSVGDEMVNVMVINNSVNDVSLREGTIVGALKNN